MSDFKVGDIAWVWVDSYLPFAKVKIIDITISPEPVPKVVYLYDVEYFNHGLGLVVKEGTSFWRDELYNSPQEILAKISSMFEQHYPGESLGV